MIDHLSVLSRKVVWLKPLFFLTTVAAFIVFGYVVLIGKSADKEVYIIPCVIGVLWSLVCYFCYPHFLMCHRNLICKCAFVTV